MPRSPATPKARRAPLSLRLSAAPLRIAGALVGLAGALLALAGPVWAQEKAYHFSDVAIDATILSDGTLQLVEERTFDFDGSFSFAFFTVDGDPALVEDFRVTTGTGEPLVTTLETLPRQTKATWYFSAADELATFRISYRVRCAVEVYRDTAHLLWQFVSTGWTEETDRVRITLHVPGRAAGTLPPRPATECAPVPAAELPTVEGVPLAPGDVRAWGHGPLGGEVRLPDPQTVTFAVDDLPAGRFVEGSVLFPVESVPFAYQAPSARRARVLADERELARGANELRRRFLANRRAATGLMVAIPLLMAGLVALAYRRDRVPGVPRHLQAPPEEIHPVELAYLWSAYRGRLSARNAYRTQLLHLARTGTIELSAVGRVSEPEDIRIQLRAMPKRRGLDRDFAEFLFEGDGSDVRAMSELRAASGRPATELRQWVRHVEARTRSNARRLANARARIESWLLAAVGAAAVVWAIRSGVVPGTTATSTALAALVVGGAVLGMAALVRTTGGVAAVIGVVIVTAVVISMLLSVLALVRVFGFEGHRGALLVAVSIVSWMLALRLMPERLPPDLRPRIARWKAFRRFLKEFSSLPEAPALAVVVWERYLVYATALDVAKEVEKQVSALIPPEELPSPLPGGPSGLEGLRFAHAVHSVKVPASAFHSLVSSGSSGSAFSSGVGSFSSGGGGGGGFSGGGGGGGGGTGGGAG